MGIRKRSSGEDPTPYIGLVEEIIEAIDGNGYSRSFVLIDCFRTDRIPDNVDALRDKSSLALVKIMSTPRRLSELFGQFAEGDWVAFEVTDEWSMPFAWELPLLEGYAQGRRRSVRNLKVIGPSGYSYRKDVKTAAAFLTKASSWAASKRPSKTVADFAKKYLHPGKIEIIVLDVGQASAALIRRDGAPLGLFDAGAPIWFNKGSLPLNFRPPRIKNGFVFLSHWDFDHFDLGRRNTEYRSLPWFAPNQPVGPNTAAFQESLGSNLTFVTGSVVNHAGFSLAAGTSSDPKDRNGTGYQLRYENGGTAVLLPGDADYQFIIGPMKVNLGGVAVPHHGGKGTAAPPANGKANAILSYGLPNSYRHPNADTLNSHKTAKWNLSHTAKQPKLKRGNRTLFP
jgi:hypothetical protein